MTPDGDLPPFKNLPITIHNTSNRFPIVTLARQIDVCGYLLGNNLPKGQ